jgi:hypothetical protein
MSVGPQKLGVILQVEVGVIYMMLIQPLTGFNLTSTLGEETVTGDINAGWGRLTWGANGWGVQGTLLLSGIQMSANIGSVSIDNQN